MPGSQHVIRVSITVYDLCHVVTDAFVAFDVVARYLRFLGYKLKYVRNVTDIDDKY